MLCEPIILHFNVHGPRNNFYFFSNRCTKTLNNAQVNDLILITIIAHDLYI